MQRICDSKVFVQYVAGRRKFRELVQRLRNAVFRYFPGRPDQTHSKPLLRKIDGLLFTEFVKQNRQRRNNARLPLKEWLASKELYDNTCVFAAGANQRFASAWIRLSRWRMGGLELSRTPSRFAESAI